jgi:hypothetical protein
MVFTFKGILFYVQEGEGEVKKLYSIVQKNRCGGNNQA